MKEKINIFDRDNHPSPAQLEATCDLFKRSLRVFDEWSAPANQEAIAMRKTPDLYRGLLETKTLLLVCRQHDDIAGLLEWDPRKRDDIIFAYITWLIVDERCRGQGLSSQMHQRFEQDCMPDLINRTRQTVLQSLTVHLKNPALHIYRKWGYSEPEASQWNDGRLLFMIKEPGDCAAQKG